MKKPSPMPVEPKTAKPAAAKPKADKAEEPKKRPDMSHRLGKWLWPKKGKKK